MISTNLFDLPVSITGILPFIGAAALAWAGWLLGKSFMPHSLNLGKPRAVNRLSTFAARDSGKSSDVPIGSFDHRVQVAFSKIGVDASGNEETYLWLARLMVGGVMVLGLLVIGLPFVTSLIGFAAGYVFVDGWVKRAWSKTCTEIESELPALLMRLSATIQASPNVIDAMEVVAKTLKAKGPLRAWTLETAARMSSEGYNAVDSIREKAAGISSSLAIAADLIGRMWTTGGEGYSKAFGAAAENLESVLDARVLAHAKGSSAQGTVNILTVMTFVMIAFISRSNAFANTMQMPLVQIAYALICLVIVYGHSQVSEIIEKAV